MTATDATTNLLQEWAMQIQTLIDAPNQAHDAMSLIHTTFGELHMQLCEAGDFDKAELVIGSYNHALAIYNQGKTYEQAFSLGNVVVTELKDQRDASMRELSGLMDAIQRGSESHPALKWYATSIRSEEREAVLDSDDVWMMADESLVEDIYTCLTHTYGLPFTVAKTLLNMIQGAQPMTEQQSDAFAAFWPMLDPERKGTQ